MGKFVTNTERNILATQLSTSGLGPALGVSNDVKGDQRLTALLEAFEKQYPRLTTWMLQQYANNLNWQGFTNMLSAQRAVGDVVLARLEQQSSDEGRQALLDQISQEGWRESSAVTCLRTLRALKLSHPASIQLNTPADDKLAQLRTVLNSIVDLRVQLMGRYMSTPGSKALCALKVMADKANDVDAFMRTAAQYFKEDYKHRGDEVFRNDYVQLIKAAAQLAETPQGMFAVQNAMLPETVEAQVATL